MLSEYILDKLSAYYKVSEFPTLHSMIEDWSHKRPLLGLRILDSTPVFRNTLLKYSALLAGGAKLDIGISDDISRDDSVVDFLQSQGIHIVTPQEANETYDIVMDCGAIFSSTVSRYGYVELTRSGVPKYEQLGVKVFAADSGVIKRIETILGTGEGYFRAMAELGYTDWRGARLTIFGSGKVGSGIILQAHHLGANITVVTDPPTLCQNYRKMCNHVVDYRDTEAVIEALSKSNAVVTATGLSSVIERYVNADFFSDKNILLANMGVEDEYGESISSDMILNHKSALNFMLEEPTHLKYIDATMSLHNLGALWLFEHSDCSGVILPPSDMEQQLLDITREFGEIGDDLKEILDNNI
jgi:adenosylhomocysteinase